MTKKSSLRLMALFRLAFKALAPTAINRHTNFGHLGHTFNQ